MNNHLISIVVPVYNVSMYLRDCLETILRQTYNNFELILVDDGSTDDSGKICEFYSSKDNRVSVIHQNNGGLSSARNAGIEVAQGSYITFVDSDDYLSVYYLQMLYEAIVKNEAEISICDFKSVAENNKPELEEKIKNKIDEVLLSPQNAIKNVYLDKYHGVDFVAWAKLYKTSLFKDAGISYPEGRLHEDTFTTYKLLYIAKKVVYIDVPLYFYRNREGSITTVAFNIKRLDMLDATREECHFLRDRNERELTQFAVKDHLHKTKFVISSIMSSRTMDKNVLQRVCDGLKQDLDEYRDYINLKQKLYYKGLAYWPKLILKGK